MERTIIVRNEDEDIEIRVKASNFALRTYRAEFNADLIRDLSEIQDKLHPDLFMDAVKKAGVNPGDLDKEELLNLVVSNIDLSRIDDQGNEKQIIPDAETQIKIMQIVWVMAKAADRKVPGFEAWCDDLDILPSANLFDRCYEMWQKATEGTVEIKN